MFGHMIRFDCCCYAVSSIFDEPSKPAVVSVLVEPSSLVVDGRNNSGR